MGLYPKKAFSSLEVLALPVWTAPSNAGYSRWGAIAMLVHWIQIYLVLLKMAAMEKDWNLAKVFNFGLEIFKKSQKLNMDSFYRENWFNISFWFRRDAVAFESNTTEVSFLNQLWPQKAKLPRQCLLNQLWPQKAKLPRQCLLTKANREINRSTFFHHREMW